MFSPRASSRQLVVLIDYELLAEAESDQCAELLVGLLSHESILLYRHSDAGPPAHAERAQGGFAEFVPGWVVVDAPKPDHTPITWAPPGGGACTRGGLFGNAADVAAADDRTDTYADHSAHEAGQQRRRDAMAAMIAGAVNADLMITRRPYLHAVTWDLTRGVLVATPEEAVPLVSLYLRGQRTFITYRSADGRATDTLSQGLFYWVAAREFLPAGWRWFAACVQHGVQDESLIYLGQSLFQRVQRALQARDAAHWALNRPQDNDTAEEALAQLDVVLLNLMAAADVLARVAHRVLDIRGSERKAAWQRRDWLERIEHASPELAAIVADDSVGRHTVTVLSKLRNSIHGAALDSLAVGSLTGAREATLVGLPRADAEELVFAIDALEDPTRFGLRDALPERLHADPGLLVDAVFLHSIRLLDDLMTATPVERLEGVALEERHHAPPSELPFDQWTRHSICWQIGLH